MDILLISPDMPSTESAQIETALQQHCVGIQIVNTYKKAIEDIARKKYAIVILYSFDAKSDIKTTEAIRIMKQIVPALLIIAVSEEKPLESERELRKSGIYYYLTKPFSEEELKDVLSGAIEKQSRRKTR